MEQHPVMWKGVALSREAGEAVQPSLAMGKQVERLQISRIQQEDDCKISLNLTGYKCNSPSPVQGRI
jgi:hypothetical protein